MLTDKKMDCGHDLVHNGKTVLVGKQKICKHERMPELSFLWWKQDKCAPEGKYWKPIEGEKI